MAAQQHRAKQNVKQGGDDRRSRAFRVPMIGFLQLQDAINDALLRIDEAWQVAWMMRLAASVADIDPGAAASAIVNILELAQARGGFAKKAAAELKRQARTKPKS